MFCLSKASCKKCRDGNLYSVGEKVYVYNLKDPWKP